MAQLDAAALERLRELDPTGSNHLLARVFAAFESSLARLLPQLVAARSSSDIAAIRLVAHTLKSSSASIGALRLSQICTVLEQLARENQIAKASELIDTLLQEAEAVRLALPRVSGTGS